ncbi:MAG: L-threonylcarbamoyladenylate synthase [Defluviitaleaceae bacterium]|nr:L-threonylcarbamoyladenylate synthase [Defluviitaleaceae bacterium]MCL2275831.1 L-threonylcarbamoyladenylate synthase [Defluviitaleaceae bacterium]
MQIVTADKSGIDEAATVIRAGGLVAMPTETVYGLAADATDEEAVARIYELKGRPGDNPLILHIADKSTLNEITDTLPDYANLLTDAYWPGPLTLVVRKKASLPAWLGGHPNQVCETVGVRMPGHSATLSVIYQSGCIIAAPSANKAGKPSPTCAEHVINDYFAGEPSPDLLVDGGEANVGVESTVIDVTGNAPVILRHGAITTQMIEETINMKLSESIQKTRAPRAPGMKYKHYAPNAPMTLLRGTPENVAAYITTQIVADIDAHIGVLVTPKVQACMDKNWRVMSIQGYSTYTPLVTTRSLGENNEKIAKNLYANLREFDTRGVDIILAEALPEDGMGVAIMDRMTKAAAGRILDVGVYV